MNDDYLRHEIEKACAEADRVAADCDQFLQQHTPERVIRKTFETGPERQNDRAQVDAAWNAWFEKSFQLRYEANNKQTVSAIFKEIEH
jgi:hypothetical protein